AIGALVAGGGVLCFLHSFTQFAVVLATFWVLNIAAWIYLNVVLSPTVKTSIDKYENELKRYDKVESLIAFDEQHRGPWQWRRWGVGLILIGFVNLLAFTPLSQSIGGAAGGIPADFVLAL